jgi:hypothetical protein
LHRRSGVATLVATLALRISQQGSNPMPWPTSQDYNEAMQLPATHVADADLCQGQAIADARGLPVRRSGFGADVYRLRCPGGDFAVKCFTREVPGLHERYAAIRAHLGQAGLPVLVDCQCLDPGIRIGTAWYPVVKMPWVEGLPLNVFVRENLGKPAVLQELRRTWVDMARRLRAVGIAHGDLQHGTVLIVSDGPGDPPKVRLIGYDGMYVPALAGQPPAEIGHPNYQHPQRLRQGTYGPEVDRFALLVVAAALCCLRVGGRWLWDRYDSGDNLLFRQADFVTPDKSPLFAELLKFPDTQACFVAARLMAAAQHPLEETPLLDDVFPQRPPEQVPRFDPAPAWREQGPLSEGAVPPRAAEPAAVPIQIASSGAPPPPIRRAPAPAAPPAAAPLMQDAPAASIEETPAEVRRLPLRKKATVALMLGGPLVVIGVTIGLLVREVINRPNDSPQDQSGEPTRVGGVNGGNAGEKKADETRQDPRVFHCAELWAKKREDLRDQQVTVRGPVKQTGWTDFALGRMWGVDSELGFVGLGDNGQGRAQVYCVFPEPRHAPGLKEGRAYRIEGIYRGPVGRDKVPLLTNCTLVADP